MRNLYLSIYLTMLAVLLVFALVAGALFKRHAAFERVRIESAVSERTAAWASLLANSLPPADAPVEVQRDSLRQWSERLRLPLALDDAAGRRMATAASFERLEAEIASEDRVNHPVTAEVLRSATGLRVPLGDGRGLWVATLRLRPPRGALGLGGWAGPPEPRGLRGPGDPPEGQTPQGGPAERGLPGGQPPADLAVQWRAPRWLDEAGTLLALLALLFVAVAAGAYPVVRRLTRRLEALQMGVEVFGRGRLAHRVNESGRDEVAALAGSFNRAAERIEKLVQANRSLLANASHELRSPLARLKMALAMQAQAAPAQRAGLEQEIDRDIHELDALVEEVLLASRLDASHRVQREPVDLLGLLAEEAARVAAEVDGTPLSVQGDERLLRRAVRNLLENARRYGGDDVQVTLRALPGERVEVRVCDRGPGVPQAQRERVFEPFYRLPGHAEREGGVGLGLSLVRQIAEQHGGQVRCEAREGGGSCFALILPQDGGSAPS